jgi:cystathionine beta-lyase/cystathionine gamma-synthase
MYCNILRRLSVGVEPAADLITDIDQALDTLEVS